ncbi:glycosyltransferase family 39 protein [Solidesulfovibrio sp.]|uniref:glycosyltransferase family 39 protein n=1 Tax=Solidesulfovibrio sp. TaxID=2910990 RepID=UPI002B1F2CD2|nr:glycosyltransferase family 39 protein [Solidesulfovibrio sp.]MEA4857869.1 glycosyltransferase family 39 protein [Solidesulfovibrio sp.]
MPQPSPPSPGRSEQAPGWPWRLALGCLLALAAWPRFYHLETPSMWWDEILVPLTARFPAAYIIDFARHCEMHPPLYHFLIKLVEAAGLSDFALRLPSALCGLAAVYALYRVGTALYGRAAGLWAAAFLAGSAMQVWHVRQVRPYALLTLLFVFSLYFLLRFLRERRDRDLWALVGVNAPLFLLHYFTFQIVFAQGLVLLANWRPGGNGVSTRQILLFAAGTLVVAVPVLLYFFLPSQTTLSIFGFKAGYEEIGRLIAQYAAMVLWSHDDLALRLFMGAWVLCGAVVLARRAPRELAACLLLVAVPAVILFLMRKTAYFSPRHFLYMTVPAALVAGQAAHLLPRPGLVPPLAVALAALGCLGVTCGHPEAYFEETSYRHPVFVTNAKPMARELAWRLRPGQVLAASDPGTVNAVSWYLDQYTAQNPFAHQRLEAGAGDFDLLFFAPYKIWGHLGKTEEAFAAAVGPIAKAEPVLNAMLYTLPVTREPAPVVSAVPYHLRRRAAFPEFYRQVAAFTDVTVNPYWGGEALATRNDSPASLEYAVDNAAGQAPQLLQWVFEYRNEGRDSTMAYALAFDDEPPLPLFTSTGPDPATARTVSLVRQRPYTRLRLLVTTVCASYTARYPGGNLETVAFRGFDLEIAPTGRFDSPGLQVAESGLGTIEHNPANLWRWGLGPKSGLAFDLPEDGRYVLECDFANVIPGQTVTIAANGRELARLADLPADAVKSLRLPVEARKGQNVVTIDYADWNQGKTAFAPTDLRTMALFFRALRLVAAP